MSIYQLESPRLVLRQWQGADLQPFADMNADEEVMRYFPSPMSFEDSQRSFNKMQNIINTNGWGWWALEHKETGEFIGATGLVSVLFNAHFVPAVEVGWRIRREHWRQGYATEAALASLEFAKTTLKLPKIVSFTAVQNIPSIGVMEKLGMTRLLPNFAHPNVADDCPLKEHVVYEIKF